MKKCLAAFVALAFVLSLFSPFSLFAAGETVRFIFSGLSDKDGAMAVGEDGEYVLSLAAGNAVFAADGLTPVSGGSNTVYLALVNSSNADTVKISYQYEVYSLSQKETLTAALAVGKSEKQEFFLHAPNVGNIVGDLQITFECAGEIAGTVTLLSLYNTSRFYEENGEDATLSRCHYNDADGTVDVAGTLSYAATVRYEGSTLALFTLSPGEEIHLSNKVPVARTGVSFSFSFNLHVQYEEELFLRYVVAAVTPTGERVPLCTPTYPVIPTKTAEGGIGFKGFHTGDFADVLKSGAEVETVDVYLDRLEGEQNGGILYAGEHSYYYFDKAYVAELDTAIRNLSGAGCNVYLRFLISADANGLSFADYTEEGGGILNKLPAIRSEEALRQMHAIVDFLTDRYKGDSVGKITGIVLGRAANCSDTYSYASNVELASYSELYATALFVIAGTARMNIPEISLIVPLLDSKMEETVNALTPSGNYAAGVFLSSLAAAMKAHSLEAPAFSVMLESFTPTGRLASDAGTHFGIDGVAEFLLLLDGVRAEYPFVGASLFYNWIPNDATDATALAAAYLYDYVFLWRNSRTLAFLVDLTLLDEEGRNAAMGALSYLAECVNTEAFSSVTASLVPALGVTALSEIFEGFTPSILTTRNILRTSLTHGSYEKGIVATGRYTMWNFGGTTSVMNWYAGSGCDSISVLSDSESRALTARLSATGRGDMAYHFSTPSNLSFAPLLRLTVGLEGKEAGRYEVELRIVGEKTTVIASTILTSPQKETLYLNLSEDIFSLNGVRSLRLSARSLEGEGEALNLRLYNFSFESPSLTDAELASRMMQRAEEEAPEDKDEAPKQDYTAPLIATAVFAFVSVAAVLVVSIRYHKKRSRETEA